MIRAFIVTVLTTIAVPLLLQDATWTLNVQKTGTDTVYQGAVNGQITITNPQNAPVTVYNINDYVQGGPQSTVSCGSPVPFQVRQYSSTTVGTTEYNSDSCTAVHLAQTH
jgi:hypothetical protein